MVCVIADPESRSRHPPQDVLVAGNPLADDEERGRNIVAGEVRDEARGLGRRRPIIKGQSDQPRLAIVPMTLPVTLSVAVPLTMPIAVPVTLPVTVPVMARCMGRGWWSRDAGHRHNQGSHEAHEHHGARKRTPPECPLRIHMSPN